jgi:hypothetical protein
VSGGKKKYQTKVIATAGKTTLKGIMPYLRSVRKIVINADAIYK